MIMEKNQNDEMPMFSNCLLVTHDINSVLFQWY